MDRRGLPICVARSRRSTKPWKDHSPCVEANRGPRILALARELGAHDVYATRDFAPRGRERDQRVGEELRGSGINVHFLDSPFVVEPGTVTTKTGSPCRVFGAFERGWQTISLTSPVGAPQGVAWLRCASASLDEFDLVPRAKRPSYFGDLPDEGTDGNFPAGERAGQVMLETFVQRVDHYDETRNVPGLDANQRRARSFDRSSAPSSGFFPDPLDASTPGRIAFRREICWREFYADVLFHEPRSATQSLQPSMRHLLVDTGRVAEEKFVKWARDRLVFPSWTRACAS